MSLPLFEKNKVLARCTLPVFLALSRRLGEFPVPSRSRMMEGCEWQMNHARELLPGSRTRRAEKRKEKKKGVRKKRPFAKRVEKSSNKRAKTSLAGDRLAQQLQTKAWAKH
ncbi:hypothetical protein BJY01DRAFT_169557 [Aspergillus pseudoustus]|uniref:Uncharacterized protein n=1 Tax=Aspergillus pseudoustus TaxID=1810923 RepID=A0ABR4KW90_9EURO